MSIFFCHALIRTLRLISKFMTSQSGKQIISIDILPNISRSIGNHTMKFGQLIEYNMRHIFLKKNYTQNLMGNIVTNPFIKIKIEHIYR